MVRAILLYAAVLVVLPQLASAVCEISVDKSTNMAPNAIATFNQFDGTVTVAAKPYCQFSDVGDGTLRLTLADNEDCMPLCTVGYMASAFYECGTAAVVVTPVCLPATKITNKVSYNGAARRAGQDVVGSDTLANYNADTAAGVLVRSFFECGMLQALLDPDGAIDNTELGKVGQGAGQCIFGTVTSTAVPYASASSKLTDDADATAANRVPWAYITSSAAAGATDTIDITFTTYVLSTASVAQAYSSATTITEANLKANADAITAAFLGTVYTAVLACGQKTGATQAAACPTTGGDGTGAFNDADNGFTGSTGSVTTSTEAADFAYGTGSNVRKFCPRSLFTSSFSGTELQVHHADNSNTCLYGVPVGGGCAPKCNANFMASEKFMCAESTTSGATAALDLDYMPTCLATNEVTFAVNYVDGNADAYPANTGSLAIYNGQAGGANSGFGARALFGCAAMELALGGTAANAGDSTGQCVVQTVGHKTVATASYKNGGVSIIGPSVKLLHASSDHTMPWATISSVASAQVTNGYTITFTMKFVPNALATATTKTEAEIATAVNAITAANFNTALASVVTNGAQMMTLVGLQWPCFGSATTYGCGVLAASTLLSDNNGIYNGPDPAANSMEAADFTFAATILASQSAICYAAATPGVGNLPTSVTNGLLNSCGQAMPPGASCTYNCSSGYTAATSYAFECSASGTSAYLTPNAGNMTCTSSSTPTPTPTPNGTTSTTGTAASLTGTYVQLSQAVTFSDLTSTAYTGDLKNLYQCVYLKCISATYCTTSSGSVVWLSTIGISSTAAATRRAAAVTFTTQFSTSVYATTALLEAGTSTLVADIANNFVTLFTTARTSTGWSNYSLPGTASAAAATYASSSAGVLIPSAVAGLAASIASLLMM